MDDQERRQQNKWLVGAAIGLMAAVGILAAIVARRFWPRRPAKPPPPEPVPVLEVEGLTEAEAEARRVEGLDNTLHLKPQRSVRRMVAENVRTILNLNLVALAGAQLLLGKPLDGLLSLGTLLLNVVLNVGQEMFAKRRLREVEEATRPQATVIREAKVRSVNLNEVVQGDMLVIGPGDQLVVDGEIAGKGQIVVDESVLSGDTNRVPKVAGDKVYAGSFCYSGRAVAQAQQVGGERLIVQSLEDRPEAKEALTSLERIIQRVLLVLLVAVLGSVTFLVARYLRIDTGLPADVVNDAISVIFSIAPSSLFFMIVVTYAMGTADLAKLGALVHRARSVETLAEASVLCFAKAGILTGTHVAIEPADPRPGQEPVADARLRQILGDFARTTSVEGLVTRVMRDAFEGSRREAREEAPFLTVYGWSGITFDTDDLRGVYILGNPQLLEGRLLAGDGVAPEEGEGARPLAALRRAVSPVGRLFGRGEKEVPQEDGDQPEEKAGPEPETGKAPDTGEAPETGGDAEAKPNLFRRMARRVTGLVKRGDEEPEEEEAQAELVIEESELLLAYRRDFVTLHDEQGIAQLPEDLIPLCTLTYSERVRPEAIETIKAFHESGVDIKVFAADAPERTVALLRQAGLSEEDGISLGALTGAEWAALNPDEQAVAVAESAVFGSITPDQSAQVVQTLRREGETVVVVGDAMNDLPALRQASLAISTQTSTQAALSVSDIILLGSSPSLLLGVLNKGQRIVHGLMDVLKLNLTQAFYLAFLIVSIRLIAYGFPYASAQGTAISVTTVALPAVGLSLWAAAGVVSQANLGRILARFVAPAASTLGLTGLVVYLIFLDRTGDVQSAQLGLTWTLVACGLLLVVFVRPPRRGWLTSTTQSGDPRPTLMVMVLGVLFVIVAAIPLAEQLLKIKWLSRPEDYAVVVLAAVAWVLVLRFVLFIVPLEPRVPAVERDQSPRARDEHESPGGWGTRAGAPRPPSIRLGEDG